MKNIVLRRPKAALALLVWALTTPLLFGQNPKPDPQCIALSPDTIRPSSAFFNYGTGSRMKSPTRRTKLTIGQTVVGQALGDDRNSYYGFWTSFLVAPLPPMVTATQGELLDRIQISWSNSPLGPFPNLGYKIYRDGVYLAAVDSKTRNFNDFNVIAGRPYNYEIRGLNIYGEGQPGKAIGFQVPNGVVTGWVQTINGTPVPDALVTLTPMQGFSARFSATAGAFAVADTGTNNNFLPPGNGAWSIAFWLQTDVATANAAILKLEPFPLYISALNSGGGSEGVAVSTSLPGTPFLSGAFPNATKNGWHHVALSFDANNQARLYIDGVLTALTNTPPPPSADQLSVGSRTNSPGTWSGRLDELRMYHRRLDELELDEVRNGTASSQTDGLKYYWKMDEELGTGSFDVLRRNKLYFCGAEFSASRPPVRTMGKTNSEGFYRIESASYGTGTTFLARPSKDFYMYRALKFSRSENDYATLPNFSLTGKATLEIVVNSAGPDGDQCLLSKRWQGNEFRLLLRQNGSNNEVRFYLNGAEHHFGDLGLGYQYLAFTIDSSGNSRTVTAYKNGQPFGAPHTFNMVNGNWSDTTQLWMVGARPSNPGQTDHFDGLIDEIALYDTTLSQASILAHAQQPRNLQEKGLRVYFGFDEGNGNRLNNGGSVLVVNGLNQGADWSPFTARQLATPHVFTPATRQVTLNPSVTSVDQVDFTDRSTVAVSGFVRYKNTDCFAKNVEILVNGASYNPKVYTDSTGKFIIDFEPGSSAILTPVFEDHQFIPAFWEVTNVVNPIAGILFNDVTTRKVSGQVYGGLCKKSIIKAPPGQSQGTVCTVKVRSADGCLERQITIDNQEGEYEFTELPPLEIMTVAVVEHSDPNVEAEFQVQGGSTVDLSRKDTIIDFAYFAPPMVEITNGLDTFPGCSPPVIVLDQGSTVTLDIRLKEVYVATPSDDGICYLDTASFRIINGFGDELLDTTLSNGLLKYRFVAGEPNPSPPYLKTLQLLGTSLTGQTGSLVKQAVITGLRNKENTFTTMMPEIPTIILRDPPGDGSSAFLEKNEKICKTTVLTDSYEVGGGGGIEVHLGGNVAIVNSTVPAIQYFIVETGPIFDIGTEFQVTYQKVSENAFQTCTTLSSKVSTNDGDLIVGGAQGGDVFMGEAINLIFGFADMVSYNDTICAPVVKTVLNVQPGNFATTFIYSEFHIRNNVIRYLDSLATNPGTLPDDKARYEESKNRWLNILKRNDMLKDSARLLRNISFDANVSYEYAETSDTLTASSFENLKNSEELLETHFGFEFNKAGVVGMLKFVSATSGGKKTEDGKEKGITVGYVLADDDPGDAFSVDIAMDSVYKTPVFRTKAGQTSCPWEPNTAHREGTSLEFRDGSGPVAVNIPANEPAVFKFTLGNTSATNETWTYAFTAGPESNPHSAVIKLNGAPLDKPIMYAIPYGESVPITVTLERGPEEYEYDSLEVVLYSLCEDERANALGILPDDDTIVYSAHYISAHFIRPCSEVNINVPEQDWVVFPNPLTSGSDDTMRITVSGYDTTVTDFQLVRLQYRRSDGDGAWINIPGVSERYNPRWTGFAALPNPKPPTLQQDFTQFFWGTTGLSDGPYEIRAVAVCTGDATDKPGFSQVIKGRIDREPPSLVGVPQPSDGVYHVGDEVSFTFNKHINCDRLIPADLTQPNNVGLYDATTGKLIDIAITCFENKIVIDPNFPNPEFENRILRVELHNIEDKTGNKRSYLDWEFYVDRNELAWLTDSLGLTKYEDETRTVTANIHNRGGYPAPFKIRNIPEWVHVVPTQGTLAPNEIRPVSFTVDSTLGFGRWADSITLRTETGQNPFFMGGDEGLPLGVRVVCRPPNWIVYPGLYENSMNMVLRVDVNGQFSNDVEDIVGAFIGHELRGRAKIQYVPSLDTYLAYLSIYGNPNDVLDSIRLEFWDASECRRYTVLEDHYTFQPDNVIGIPDNPEVIHTGNLVLRDVPFGFGWNWLSFNLQFPDNSVNAALASLQHPQNDLMKNQTAFSTYNLGNWLGSLTNLTHTTMYVYRADVNDTLRMKGYLVDPATTPIPLVTGWNWIGYLPNYALPINEALASLPSQKGDLIKGQLAFAQYIDTAYGWVGNLKYLSAPNGYQIKVAVPGSLVYPPPAAPLLETPVAARGGNPAAYWTVQASAFEHSMTFIGMLSANGQNGTGPTMELGAFAGDALRGGAQAIYIQPLDAYLFFMTCYANTSGEQLRFRLYDGNTGAVHDLNETMFFLPDRHQGAIDAPLPFTLQTSGMQQAAESGATFEVQPNPFHSETTFRLALPKAETVVLTITDASGREIARRQIDAQAGLNTFRWDGRTDSGQWLNSGVFVAQLQLEKGRLSRKLVLQRLP